MYLLWLKFINGILQELGKNKALAQKRLIFIRHDRVPAIVVELNSLLSPCDNILLMCNVRVLSFHNQYVVSTRLLKQGNNFIAEWSLLPISDSVPLYVMAVHS